MKEPKDKHLLFRLSPTERRMLDAMAEKTGLTMSAYLRQAIRREHRRFKREQRKRFE